MLYLIEILHQTTTRQHSGIQSAVLYLIEILHQTTTRRRRSKNWRGCILSKFYIKPQLSAISFLQAFCCILSKFYIKPQLYYGKGIGGTSCILSKFYIKPQPYRRWMRSDACCILSKFYIKPQHSKLSQEQRVGCILSKFYIKPQRSSVRYSGTMVVSYRNSTSNHNSVLHSFSSLSLYLIEILHQTTTSGLILIDKVLLTGCLPL